MTKQQIEAIQLAAHLIIESVMVAGPSGAPSGVVFAALNAHGMSLATYQSLLDALQRRGSIVVEHDCIKFGGKD